MILRPYQSECVSAVWNDLIINRTALVVLSTGSGKSVIINELIRKSLEAKPDIKILVAFNRVTLLSQLGQRFENYFGQDKVGFYCGTEQRWENHKSITVGSIQSLKLDDLNYNLIIFDEVHNVNEEEGRYADFIKHQIQQNEKTKIVGFTATAYRADGFIYGKGKLFTHITYERGLKFFIKNKFLVPPVCKQPDHQIDLKQLRVLRGEYRQDDIDAQTMNLKMAQDQVRDALNRSQGRKKIVWACASINHAELIRDLLREENETALTLHSKMDWDARNFAEDEFKNGQTRHLTFVTVISEGYDQTDIDCVVFMRPTKSPALMVQIVGRGLRLHEGKDDCLVLDYGNVISTLGPLEAPVIQKKGKGTSNLTPSQKSCPECRTYVAPRTMLCPDCGYNWPKADALKLNLTADENVSFFAKTIKTMKVNNVRLSHHISRSSTKSFKLSYMPPGIFLDAVNEFFCYESIWGMRNFLIRAYELGITIKEDPLEQVKERPTKIPVAIEYFLNGKYPKIQRLVYDSENGSRA
jgi:DNA repair protein RadD